MAQTIRSRPGLPGSERLNLAPLAAGHGRASAELAAGRQCALSRTEASEFGGAHLHCRVSLSDRVMKQFEHEAKGRQVVFVDGAVIVALERVADDAIHFGLHGQYI